jgi:hypothetical protein
MRASGAVAASFLLAGALVVSLGGPGAARAAAATGTATAITGFQVTPEWGDAETWQINAVITGTLVEAQDHSVGVPDETVSQNQVMVQTSPASGQDSERELDTAKWVWSLLRSTTQKLAMDPANQVNGPEIDECFDWDPSYQMSERCEERGWISAELRQRLDRIEELLSQLSSDRTAWSDEGIFSYPLWEQVRLEAREAVPLMQKEPWASHSG